MYLLMRMDGLRPREGNYSINHSMDDTVTGNIFQLSIFSSKILKLGLYEVLDTYARMYTLGREKLHYTGNICLDVYPETLSLSICTKVY